MQKQIQHAKAVSINELGTLIMENMNIDKFLDENRCFGYKNIEFTLEASGSKRTHPHRYEAVENKIDRARYELQPTTMAVWRFLSEQTRKDRTIGIRVSDIKRDKTMLDKLHMYVREYNAKSSLEGSRIGECIQQLCKPEKSKKQVLKHAVLEYKEGFYYVCVDICDIQSVVCDI